MLRLALPKYWLPLSMMLCILFVSWQPVAAQVTPSMRIFANWTPDEQLTSFDEDGDALDGIDGSADANDPYPADGIETAEYRYVDAQFVLDGNVQFWALDFTCRIGNGTQLDLVSISFPQEHWGVQDQDFFISKSFNDINTEFIRPPWADGGRVAFTVTRVGASTSPVGLNGVKYSMALVNLRFRVKNLPYNQFIWTGCAGTRFLNRDGRVVAWAAQGAFTHLNTRVGYTLTGNATRQGAWNKYSIRVICTHLASGNSTTAWTNWAGNFFFGGGGVGTANHLRRYGLYECVFDSDINRDNTPDAQFLESRSLINLQTPSYTLLSVAIRPGDFDGNNIVELADLNAVTSNFGLWVGNFGNGDANGDGIPNSNDIALVAGNISLSDNVNPIAADHVLYSLGTDYNPNVEFPNSKVQVGTPESGAIRRLNIYSPTRDFWATLSPDGKEVAYSTFNPFTKRHQIRIANSINGAFAIFRSPYNFKYQEFLAPSWSPDGNILAFACTTLNLPNDARLLLNQADICYANRGDTYGSTWKSIGINSEIFPPAWFSYQYGDGTGYAIIYSENDQIKYYDLTSATFGIIPDIPANSDMPVVINHYAGEGYLFYRHFDGADNVLRVVRLTNDSADPANPANGNNTYLVTAEGLDFTGVTNIGAAGDTDTATADSNPNHMLVDNSTGVEYYDVSPQLNIMFYDDTEYDITNLMLADVTPSIEGAGGGAANWDAGTIHYVDGNIGSPSYDAFLGPGSTITGETWLHAHRVTFDWVP